MSSTEEPVATGPATISVVPDEAEWGGRDDRWRADVFELEQALRRHVPEAVSGGTATEGAKGVELVEVVVQLASAGAFSAAIEGMKLWLSNKPTRRSLKLRYDIEGRQGELTADATNIDSADVRAIAASAFAQRP